MPPRPEGSAVVARNILSEIEARIEHVYMLVDRQSTVADATLAEAAKAAGLPVIHVGDCMVPRGVYIAIADGVLAARTP